MKTLHLLLTLLLLRAAAATAPAADRLNILLVCVDDLKPTLGAYGDPLAQTPHFDRFAARGVLCERAYCSQAVCAPSRNALMTGLRPTTLGIYDLGTNFRKAAPGAVTVAQHFRAHGYRTEALGKIFHVGHGNVEDPASWSVPHLQVKSIQYQLPESRAKEGLTREEAFFANKSPDKLPRGAAFEAPDVPDEAYADGQLAAEAIRRLEAAAAKPDEPFFLALGFVKPHLPFCAPKKYWDRYDRAAFTLPARRTPPDGAPSYAPQNSGELRQYAGIPENGPLDEDLARTLIHGYYAATSYVDAQFGRVLAALETTGLAKNTLVVVWGDHGWHLGDHGMWCKHTNYEQAARIPLLIAGPGVTPGRAASFIETVDLYPTLAACAGLPAPPQGDGRSFAALLRDPAAAHRDAAFHCYPRGERLGRALRTATHRLVEWKKPGAPAETAEIELYDYATDPAETKNLAASQPEIVAELRARLARDYPEAKAPWRAAAAAPARPAGDRAAMFARHDEDKDGRLTRAEFLKNQPDPEQAPARFLQFDADKDGTLSRDEFIHRGQPPTAR